MKRNLSPTKQDPSSYYKAVNKSIVTDNVDSTGAISDEIGNLIVTNAAALSGEVSTGYILKVDTIRDWLVAFIKGGTDTDKIVKFKLEDDTITNFSVVYSSISLDLGTNIETVYRYRDENFCKLYWVDGVNQLRSINIFDADSASIPLALLDATPVYATSQPQIIKVLAGGMYKSGKVQYAYQLYNIDGSETVISPVSYAVPLTESSLLGETYTFKGSDSGEDTGKSIRISISNIDSTFDYIKIIAIHYEDIGAPPIINVVEERDYRNFSNIYRHRCNNS